MKKIFLIIAAVMFTVSVSAHEQTKSFQKQFGTAPIVNTTATTSMYTINNGGLIKFIYKIFYKVGQALHATVNDSPDDEDKENSENNS